MGNVSSASLRVLGRLRLSRATQESTSVQRQQEIVQLWADANGHTVVGWAVDSDVSGSLDPFETPQLGAWLRHRVPEFDVIAVWKLDRLSRNSIKLNKLFGWCIDNGKTVVSASEAIDLATPHGRLIANVIGFLAEGELEAIRERQLASKRKLRELGRWAGGKAPFGYRGVRRDDGAGWRLEVDKPAAEVVQRIVDDFIGGRGVFAIANNLRSEGYRTPAFYHRAAKAISDPERRRRELKGPPEECQWKATAIRNMLRSKALRGVAHHHGETVRDDDGQPVQVAEPLVDIDDWDLIQAELDRLQESRRNYRRSVVYPLSGVAVCFRCDSVLYHSSSSVKRATRTYEYRHYKCSNPSCDASLIPAEELEELAEDSFLAQVGEIEVRQRVWVPGDSHEAELREQLAALDELMQGAGRATSAAAKERYRKQLDTVDARIAELESAPGREARWEYRPTGQTYQNVWASSDADARRDLIVRSGIQIRAAVSGRTKSSAGTWDVSIYVPYELYESLGIGPAEDFIKANEDRRRRYHVELTSPPKPRKHV